MDHKMVLSYDYSNQNRRRWRTNAPPRPMQHNQGFTGSHWTPSSGDYSLRITLAASRAIINTTMMQHVPTLLAILMAIAMRRYFTVRIARWRSCAAFIKATKCRHRGYPIGHSNAGRVGHIAVKKSSS